VQKKDFKLTDYKDISDCLQDADSDKEAVPIQDTKKRKEEDTKKRHHVNDLLPLDTSKKISLFEIGPRIQLQLIKIQEGLCKGKTRYHKFHPEPSTPQSTPNKIKE